MKFFEKQPDESAKAYAAFACYRDLGPERSTRKVAQRLGRSVALIQRWSRRHAWVARAGAYDNLLEMERHAAVEDYERTKAVELAARNRRVDEGYIKVKELMLEKALSMWGWPLESSEVVEYYEDGRAKTVISRPARWSFNTGVKVAEALDPTPGRSFDMSIDLSEATHEQLERIAAGEDPLKVLGFL